MQVLIALIISLTFCGGHSQKETQLDWAELRPILERLKLPVTKDPNTRSTRKIEEVDAESYRPVSGVTLFLRTSYFTEGRIRPRYWMRVEDYSTAEAASKRAAEYRTADTYERLGRLPLATEPPDKTTLRLWAVARGKRVYALTTDALLFERDSLQEKLKVAVNKLPEK